MKPCECGCSGEVKPGKRFIRGHHVRVNNPFSNSETIVKIVETKRTTGVTQRLAEQARSRRFPQIQGPLELCYCGCQETVRIGAKFIHGHHVRVNNPFRNSDIIAKAVTTKRNLGIYQIHSERVSQLMKDRFPSIQGPLELCYCKCGEPVKLGKKFLPYHHLRVKEINPFNKSEVKEKIRWIRKFNGPSIKQIEAGRRAGKNLESKRKMVNTRRNRGDYLKMAFTMRGKGLLGREGSRQHALKLHSEGKFPTRSRPQIYVEEFLSDQDIKFEVNQVVDDMFELDIILDSVDKIAIETHGCYFHACKERFPEYTIHTPGISSIWYKDKLKARYLEKQGWKILVVWEHDLPKLGSLLSTFFSMVPTLSYGFYFNFPEYHPANVDSHAEKLIRKQIYLTNENEAVQW